MTESTEVQPDLSVCDREPITRLERIQSFGFLLAVSKEWIVTRASANLDVMLGVAANSAIGAALDDLIEREALHDIRNRMVLLYMTRGPERLYGVVLNADRPPFDVAVHLVGNMYVLEGEPTGKDDRLDAAAMVRAMILRLGAASSIERFHRDAVRQIQAMTGFSRVMIYQFDADASGKVIAEANQSGAEDFLGLQFPGSDIPSQARALYLKNSFRIIGDVGAPPVDIVSAAGATLEPLDLSLAISRAVSPVHIEYLRNMGVQASLSISIIVDGALWGLIACHHRAARVPSFVVRTAAELFGQMYSMKLESRLRHERTGEESRARQLADRMVTAIEADVSLLTQADWMQQTLAEMISCDGLAIQVRGNFSLHGVTPSQADIAHITQRLNLRTTNHIFATEELALLQAYSSTHEPQAAGLLAIPLSRTARDYILLFRRERLGEIKWAGDPRKAVATQADGAQLSPRKSFEAFSEAVRGRSLRFSDREQRTAETIRVRLLDFVLRARDGVDDADKPAIGRQDLLIAELNHRVRNVLSLIRGLISQSRGDAGDIESYVKSLDERVQALARAHNQLTRHTWGPAPLEAIFADEISAYVPTQRERFTVNGPAVWLHPQAFSTLALVIHELVTNSAKYGSLSDSGRVEVTLTREADNGLILAWRERGGPSVRPPLRRGFGSVLIERTIPFDLQGSATVRYAQEGFEADFFIPERHISAEQLEAEAPARSDVMVLDVGDLQPLTGMRVLLLEDNLIVALEAEDMLVKLGAKSVRMASNLATAAQVLDGEIFDFAVLDINLGIETTQEVAERIRAAHIPFIFASGYGGGTELPERHQSALVVSKPYDGDALRQAIAATLAVAET